MDLKLLAVLIIAGGVLVWVAGWWLLWLYRQWQITKFYDHGLVFPNEHSKFASVFGVKLHYVVEGSGPDVILLHGIAANIYCWRHVIPLLARHHRVWAIDLKGFGLSDKPKDGAYDLRSQAKLIHKFLEDRGVEKCTIVGNSMGGAIAAEVAIQAPHVVDRLVMINSAHDATMFLVDAKNFKRLARMISPFAGLFTPVVNKEAVRAFMRTIYGKPREITDDDVRAYMAPYIQGRASHLAFLAAIESMLDTSLTERLTKCGVKTLIIWGRNDKLVNIKYGEKLHREFPGSVFEVHPEAGHHLQEEEPEWLAERIKTFADA